MLKHSIGIKLFEAITGEEEIIDGKSTGGSWYGTMRCGIGTVW